MVPDTGSEQGGGRGLFSTFLDVPERAKAAEDA